MAVRDGYLRFTAVDIISSLKKKTKVNVPSSVNRDVGSLKVATDGFL